MTVPPRWPVALRRRIWNRAIVARRAALDTAGGDRGTIVADDPLTTGPVREPTKVVSGRVERPFPTRDKLEAPQHGRPAASSLRGERVSPPEAVFMDDTERGAW